MNKPIKLAAILIPLVAGPASAQALEHPSSPTSHRLSLELGAGLTTSTPFVHARLNYRLPALNDRIDLFVDQTGVSFTPLGASFAQTTLIGAKYYFWEQRPFGAFFGAGGGISYGAGLAGVAPGFIAGFGGDWLLTDAVGASLGIYGSYPIGFRPEVNLKIGF